MASVDTDMRAVIVPRHGGADVLEVRSVPTPPAGPGELLVEVLASGVNFIDVYQRKGIYPTEPPFGLGVECAGRVLRVGEGVQDVAVGDLMATAAGSGTHANLTIVPAAAALPVPDGVAPDDAAASMLQGMTAHYLVHSTYAVAEGDDVLVHAAAGGVGRLLVQMAKAQGARVIATVGSAEKVSIASGVGADDVIRYDEVADLAGAVRDLAPDGVHVVYDGVGKATFDASLASLRRRGMLVVFGAASGAPAPVDVQQLNAGGSLFLTRPMLAHYTATRQELLHRAGDVLASVADGSLSISIGGRYALDDAAKAYGDLEGRRSTGKLLIVP